MMNPNMFGSNNNTEMNNHPNPSSIEEINNSYLYFPDPFLEYHNLFSSHFLSQQQIFNGGEQEQEQEKEQEQKQDQNSDKKATRKLKIKKCSSRKTGKKDRHSKIYTAQGPRDRRMRLSLQIARKFFDLQDMLGFDKASQTIEWLISNSNSAIQDLKHSSNEVIAVSEINNKDVPVFMAKPEKINRPSRESRDRARARARQRTILKKTQLVSISQHPINSCFNFQDGILEETHFQDCPTARTQHKVFDDLLDMPSILGFFSGNK